MFPLEFSGTVLHCSRLGGESALLLMHSLGSTHAFGSTILVPGRFPSWHGPRCHPHLCFETYLAYYMSHAGLVAEPVRIHWLTRRGLTGSVSVDYLGKSSFT